MTVETLNCPGCGAAAETDATHCSFCRARLATVACKRCLSMMFAGSQHCSHCGASVEQAAQADASAGGCPSCRVEMETVEVNATRLGECARCGGLWVDVKSLEQLVAEREGQAAVLGAASFGQGLGGAVTGQNKVRYVPCPACGQLMNRVNFARCSGVVVDVCKGHGTWFDKDELRQIVEFIRAGGLETSRAREKRELEEERARLRQEQLAAATHRGPLSAMRDMEDRRSGVAHVARELLRILGD